MPHKLCEPKMPHDKITKHTKTRISLTPSLSEQGTQKSMVNQPPIDGCYNHDTGYIHSPIQTTD